MLRSLAVTVSDLSLIERVKGRVAVGAETGCWLFEGACDSHGYGLLRDKDRRAHRLVHRVMYEAFFGAIPQDVEIHHICKNKNCCNPGHLMLVSHQEHMKLSPGTVGYDNRAKTRCKAGHPFDEMNTRIESNGGRRCLTCKPQYDKARHEERRQREETQKEPQGLQPTRYQEKRARMTPEEIAAFRARAAFNALERRRRDPERIRALERAKYERRLARDSEGYRAKRRAIARRYEKKRRGVVVKLVFA
jgi:hypothetical protein